MADIKNIRLTDFIQGLQEEDVLDYPVDAVRAGGNVTLAETIQTRGGISTVDSVGLPANSEIMALQQVKFPTNEKTFMIAQVKSTVSNASPIEIQPNIDLDLNTPTYRQGLYLFGGTEDGGDGGTDRDLSFLSMSIEYNSIPVFAIDFNVDFTDTTGNNGVGTEIGSIEGYGREYNSDLSQYVYRTMYEGPYLYFPDADAELWTAAIQSELLGAEVIYKDTSAEPTFTKRWPCLAYYDGTDWFSVWFNPLSALPGFDSYSSDIFSTTKTAAYYILDEDYLLGTKRLGGSFTIPDEVNVYVFDYEANIGGSPYLSFTTTKYLGGVAEELRITGSNIVEVQIFIDGENRLQIAFGSYGLTDLSGNQGVGLLSSGSYEDILNEDGSVTLEEGQYIYFPNQRDADWFEGLSSGAEVIYRAKGVVAGEEGAEASSARIYGYRSGGPTTHNITFSSTQKGALFHYNAYGEIAWDAGVPIWNIPIDSIVAMEATATDVPDESPSWFFTVSASYVGDVPTSTTSYGLYAMPDTLPDTGA